MSDNLKANLTSSKHWLRFLYMALFALILYVAMMVTWLLVVVQFIFALLTGNDNDALRRVCDSLSTYIYQMIRFLTYNSEDKPFPFSDWPPPEEPEDAEELPEMNEAEEEIIQLVDDGEEPASGEEAIEVESAAVETVEPQVKRDLVEDAANDAPQSNTPENAAGEPAEKPNDNDNPDKDKKDV